MTTSDLTPREKTTKDSTSPDVVRDGEALLRTFFSPINFDENGELLSSAITDTDMKLGFSVDRQTHVDSGVIERRAAKHCSKKPMDRQECSLSPVVVEDIRNIRCPEGNRQFEVIDDPEPSSEDIEENPAHALIRPMDKNLGPGGRKRVKRMLLPFFNKFYKIDLYFSDIANAEVKPKGERQK